jgi:hypothetical protein
MSPPRWDCAPACEVAEGDVAGSHSRRTLRTQGQRYGLLYSNCSYRSLWSQVLCQLDVQKAFSSAGDCDHGLDAFLVMTAILPEEIVGCRSQPLSYLQRKVAAWQFAHLMHGSARHAVV